MSAAAPDSPSAVLDALIHGSAHPVSFRALSARLSIPSRQAQSHLLSYVSAHPSDALCVLWCVTHLSASGVRRLSLTTTPSAIPSPLATTVWAVAAPALRTAPSPSAAWLAADAAADLAAVAAPSHQANPLRDGRYNAIRSETAAWKPADQTLPVLHKKPSAKTAPRKTSGLLAEVKAKVKARDAKRAAARNRPAAFTPAPDGASSFASKRLGADAAARIKAADRKEKDTKKNGGKPAPPAKKGRRVIEEDDDDDDDDESDGEKERMAMEKEAAERELAEREAADAEREELRLEVEELTKQHEDEHRDDEPESPELKDVGVTPEEENAEEKQESPNRSPTKRKLNDAFGLPSVSGPRRIRREVEETVEKDGYLVTRCVTKVFDENDNEIVEEDNSKVEPEKVEKPKSPLKPHNSQNGKPVTAKLGSQKKGKGKDAKRPTSKMGANGGTKKTPKKKIKGNIMSYFGKKS